MSKHTKGPWFTKREGFSTVYVEAHIEDGFLQEVAACGPTKAGRQQQDANARLIAAAPEILEALKWHCDALDLGDVAFYERHGFNVSEVMPRTRAIVKKAEGEQQ